MVEKTLFHWYTALVLLTYRLNYSAIWRIYTCKRSWLYDSCHSFYDRRYDGRNYRPKEKKFRMEASKGDSG